MVSQFESHQWRKCGDIGRASEEERESVCVCVWQRERGREGESISSVSPAFTTALTWSGRNPERFVCAQEQRQYWRRVSGAMARTVYQHPSNPPLRVTHCGEVRRRQPARTWHRGIAALGPKNPLHTRTFTTFGRCPGPGALAILKGSFCFTTIILDHTRGRNPAVHERRASAAAAPSARRAAAMVASAPARVVGAPRG